MNTIEITFNKIILRVDDPLYRNAVVRITGKVKEKGMGVYEMALSTHNLKRIADFFPPEQKPTVVKGRSILDDLKRKLAAYKQSRDAVEAIQKLERYPVEPNGKFVPYAHQTKIIGIVDSNPYAPVFSDCGTGKTGALARSAELHLAAGTVKRGKILVSAPLSILHTSWEDDIRRFTGLNPGILWTKKGNETILGDKVVLCTLPEKPANAVTTKSKKAIRWKHKVSGQILAQEPTALDRPDEWLKYQAEWKVAVTLEGFEQPFGIMYGRQTSKDNTKEKFILSMLADPAYDLYLINHDGVRIWQDLLKAHGFEWVVVDESTKIKSPDSQVFKSHVDISWKAKRRTILSGTPNPNGFVDLWSQFYFLDRGMTLEPALKDFLGEYFVGDIIGYQKTPEGDKARVKYVVRDETAKTALINRVRSVGICLEQRDCIDLPPRTDMRRVVYMTPEQERAYLEMAEDLVARLENKETGKIVEAEAVNVLAQIMKLRQITSGFLVNREGEEVEIAGNPKTAELEAIVEELGGKKCVVAAQFSKEIAALTSHFKHIGAQAIQGGVAVERRAEIVRDFQNTENCGMVILQPAAASHGLTLTAASHMVLVSYDYNFEYYYQVIKRIERLGQKSPIFVIHLVARFADGESTIDEDLIDCLGTKAEDRDALFSGNQQNVVSIAQRLMNNISQQVKERR